MSIVAIVNLAERLLNHSSEQGQDSSTTSKQNKPGQAAASSPTFEDQFTSSSVNGLQNQQEPGLFQVNRFALFSAAANFFLAQAPNAAPANPEATQVTKTETTSQAQNTATVRPVTNVDLAPVAAVSTPAVQPANNADTLRGAALNVSGPTAIQAPANTEEVQAATSIPQTASSSAQPNAQSQIQALNNALAALGLSAADMAVIDRIAALISDFNPTAYTSLVQQLEFLAQSQAAAPANGSSPLANPSNGLQIQELTVRFSAVNETLQSGNAQTGGGTKVQVSAFNLQVEGIRITFTNNVGKTVQVEAPQAASGGNSPGGAAPNNKARAANA